MKRNFLTGLVIILPIALTLVIVTLIIDLLTQPFLAFTQRLLENSPIAHISSPMISSEEAIKIWSQVFILIAIFLMILLLGFFAKLVLFKYLVKFGDSLIQRIPIINKLYKTVKEVTNVIFTSNDKAFKQVVLVDFPNPHVKSIGFLSRDVPESFNKTSGDILVSVFIPTTPNPTTGYLVQFPKKEVTYIDMPIEDALKFIVSCGIVNGDTLAPEATNTQAGMI